METVESDIGRGKAPVKRTRVVRLWQRDMLRCHFRGPEFVGRSGLLYAFLRETGVGPDDGFVPVLL